MTRSRNLALGALASVALAAGASIGTAGAAPKPVVDLSGGGTWTTDSAGSAVVTGTASVYDRHHEPHTGTLRAVLTADDGSLPEPEVCEPGSATFEIDGDRVAGLVLAGSGRICGVYPQLPTYVVTHVFTGRYEVVEADRRQVVGTDGWYSVRLGLNGQAGVEAYDT